MIYLFYIILAYFIFLICFNFLFIKLAKQIDYILRKTVSRKVASKIWYLWHGFNFPHKYAFGRLKEWIPEYYEEFTFFEYLHYVYLSTLRYNYKTTFRYVKNAIYGIFLNCLPFGCKGDFRIFKHKGIWDFFKWTVVFCNILENYWREDNTL
jgi:hypothetical protein